MRDTQAVFAQLEQLFAVCDVDGTGHAHRPLLELIRRAVAPPAQPPAPTVAAPDAGRSGADEASAAPPPPKPDLVALERDAQARPALISRDPFAARDLSRPRARSDARSPARDSVQLVFAELRLRGSGPAKPAVEAEPRRGYEPPVVGAAPAEFVQQLFRASLGRHAPPPEMEPMRSSSPRGAAARAAAQSGPASGRAMRNRQDGSAF